MMTSRLRRSSGPLKTIGLLTFCVLGYQNCAPGELSSTTNASTSSPQTYTITDGNPSEVIDSKAYAVSSSENMLTALVNKTGVTAPSTATRNAANVQLAKVAEFGKPEGITAPMWVAVTSLSGEVCNDLIAQERALTSPSARRFFGSIDFTRGPASVTSAAQADVIRRMARSFWARNETPQERALIQQGITDSFSGTTANETKQEMVYICTAMLSSLDAHKY